MKSYLSLYPWIFSLLLLGINHGFGNVVLPSIISDHMVLQKGTSIPIWGKADPGEKVAVNLGAVQADTQADAAGKWKVLLDLSKLDGSPHSLIVQGNNRIEVQDVLVGEVWVCSGQSNMAFGLRDALGADQDIPKSADSLLRVFHYGGAPSPQPLDDCSGKWVLTDPAKIIDFSAVGYYFGRKLRETLDCPIGLIGVYWGGTPIEPWTSYDALSGNPDLKASTDAVKNQWEVEFPKQKADFAQSFPAWQEKYKRTDASPGNDPSFITGDDKDWAEVNLPGKLADQGFPDAGAIWLRKEVTVDNMDMSVPWIVSIGTPNCFYTVYWNGKLIGKTRNLDDFVGTQESWQACVVPGNVPHLKVNSIAIRLFNPVEDLGIITLPGQMNRLNLSVHTTTIPLTGAWKVKIEQALPKLDGDARKDLPPMPVKPKMETRFVGSYLYNSLINPLTHYAIKGVIWYQGEANTGRAFQYRQAFPLMIADWREKWGRGDFPFYFCQLANFGQKSTLPGENEWAELREAQSMALKLPNTGQAVLIDIGEAGTIHPRNKKDAGERLARLALANTYGKAIPFSGPVYDSMKVEGGHIRLFFKYAEGLKAAPLPADYVFTTQPPVNKPLVRNSPLSSLEGFAICGDDHKWVWADAHIDGNTVVVESASVPNPVAVRYAWAGNPTANLYNGAGLPASPFRTDDFPCSTANVKY